MIGQYIRELRKKNNFLIRQLAAELDIDTAMLSKMERDERFFKKKDIIKIAKIFNANSKELQTLWLANKITKSIENEEFAREALNIAIHNLSKKQCQINL